MIIRSWICLNRHCVHEYDAEGDYPPCPRCGGLRVKWVPRPVAIRSEKTKAADASVRQLTDIYGDKNYRSPRRHEAMAPKVNPTTTAGKTMRFEPKGMAGWSADLPLDGAGNPVAICSPTGVTAKVSLSPGQLGTRVPESGPSLGKHTRFDASHRPPK